MKIKRIITILFFLLVILSILTVGSRINTAYTRPAIGFTVKGQEICKLEVSDQKKLNIKAQNGKIAIKQWDEEYIQITNDMLLKGPSSKEKLKKMLDDYEIKKDTSYYSINIDMAQEEELKPLYRKTDDLEILVPDSIKSIEINAESGIVDLSGLNNIDGLDIELDRGSINIGNCSAKKTDLVINTGDIKIAGLDGAIGTFECGRGDMILSDISGNVEIKSTSGSTRINNFNGKLTSEIYSGSIEISDSRMTADTSIYASYGNISVDLNNIDDTGAYSIMSANGDIKLKMPEKSGWSIIARASKGRIKNSLKDAGDSLKTSPTGELYGDVSGGGANVNVFAGNGNIYLK